jgi:hypothetical protein
MSNFLAQACINLRPEAGVSIDENGIHWHGIDSVPTQAELDAEVARLEAEFSANAYKAKRAVEYPPIGDQLDALWKGGNDAAEMLAKVQAVKAKYPKEVTP